MIIIDLETTGIDPSTHSILSIGAVDFDTGETFYRECRKDFYAQYTDEALTINGFTLDQINDKTKPTSVQIYHDFVKWSKGRSTLLAGHNVGGFDLKFLQKVHSKQRKFSKFPYQFRTVDLHSLAYQRFGKSLSMSAICKKLGIEPEPDIHNALTGAQKEYECFKLLLKN